jgi:hypothetical protein
MRTRFICTLTFLFSLVLARAQNNIGIGTPAPDPSAVLHLESNNKGFLVTRMPAQSRINIPSPANGLLVYDTDSSCFFFWRSAAASWINLCGGGGVGSPGPTGPTGTAGINGANGVTGPTGPSGTGGGATGPTGPTGPTGSGGGATGPTGAAGTNGTNGANGTNGTIGPTGVAGTNGINGVTGPAGPTGPTGAGGGATGPTGAAGTNGTNGTTGPTGPGGGATGPTGAAGANGTNGAIGPAGPTGPVGAPGANGTNGAAGPAGPAGAPGPAGAIGPTGPAGGGTSYNTAFSYNSQTSVLSITDGGGTLTTDISPMRASIKGTTNISTSSTTFVAMAGTTLTFTPKKSMVYIIASTSGDVDIFTNQSPAYVNVRIRNTTNNTTILGGGTICNASDATGIYLASSWSLPLSTPYAVVPGVPVTIRLEWQVNWGNATAAMLFASPPLIPIHIIGP